MHATTAGARDAQRPEPANEVGFGLAGFGGSALCDRFAPLVDVLLQDPQNRS